MSGTEDTALRSAWNRARVRYPADAHLPVPLWMSHGLPDDPVRTWEALRAGDARKHIGAAQRVRSMDVVTPGNHPASPTSISVYVHIPFCSTRCPFCDCHSVRLPRDSGETVEHYLRILLAEIDAWASLPGVASCPVTTVHFGGGTPLVIGENALGQIINALCDAFTTDERTEWAIETTARSLDAEGIAALDRLGFRRIHAGVQSLTPDMRRLLGRRGSPEVVLDRLTACVARGWVVSADFLYGLPDQTAGDLCSDIERIEMSGVDGVSLYHLNCGSRNHSFMARHGLVARNEERLFTDFMLLARASARLESLGYARNHVTHFARGQDRNLYSRHALRSEDLLAFGSSADGVFGARFYRHHEFEHYCATAPASPGAVLGSVLSVPPLSGSGVYSATEWRAYPLVAALMASEVHERNLDFRACGFLEELEQCGLVVPDEHAAAGRSWSLTDTGSWFSGAITAEAWELYAESSESSSATADS